jgi:alkyl hydroperoxide reductase subunit D
MEKNMSIEVLQNALPDYAKDLRLNLSTLVNEDILSDQQKWGTFLSAALNTANADVIAVIESLAGQYMTAEAINAARAAASIMAMNNVYYKFAGMMGTDYQTMPAKLRMNIIGNPGVDKVDFELWSLAVSAMNGCQFCVQAHEAVLVKAGMSREQIQASVRIAAVVNAIAATLGAMHAMPERMQAAA